MKFLSWIHSWSNNYKFNWNGIFAKLAIDKQNNNKKKTQRAKKNKIKYEKENDKKNRFKSKFNENAV